MAAVEGNTPDVAQITYLDIKTNRGIADIKA